MAATMSALEADVTFDFTFSASPSPSFDDPATPPLNGASLDGSFNFNSYPQDLLELPYNSNAQYTRSSSRTPSIYSAASSAVISATDLVQEPACIPFANSPNASPPVRQHGPLLLPRIRSQDQEFNHCQDFQVNMNYLHQGPGSMSNVGQIHQTTPPPAPKPYQAQHGRSYTNPEINSMAFAHMSPFTASSATPPPPPPPSQRMHDETAFPSSLLYSPASFAQKSVPPSRRASCQIDTMAAGQYGNSPGRQILLLPSTPTVVAPSGYVFPSASCLPGASSSLNVAAAAAAVTPEPTPSTTLMTYLTAHNPAASLVRTISFPLRDPSIKHFWWDIRNVRSWANFNASAILSLPGASDLLNASVPVPALPAPTMSSRHPETEAGLYSIYASYYLPKLNSALAISYGRALQLSVPAKTASGVNDLIFVANAAGESSTATAIFGGKPTARVVGLVRSFSRFNTGMRVEGNIKCVDYLRGLAALHYAMREHGCRYGFILTEIELVLVRAGTTTTPFFGDLEITSVQLSAAAAADAAANPEHAEPSTPLTACLALWGLCQLAGDATPAGHAHWKAEIGAPAEGTRRKFKPRDNWIPKPQLAEKREAKRSRGWVWPEDPIGRKELGKRGVKYGGI